MSTLFYSLFDSILTHICVVLGENNEGNFRPIQAPSPTKKSRYFPRNNSSSKEHEGLREKRRGQGNVPGFSTLLRQTRSTDITTRSRDDRNAPSHFLASWGDTVPH